MIGRGAIGGAQTRAATRATRATRAARRRPRVGGGGVGIRVMTRRGNIDRKRAPVIVRRRRRRFRKFAVSLRRSRLPSEGRAIPPKFDPKLVAAARELKDRWLEHV